MEYLKTPSDCISVLNFLGNYIDGTPYSYTVVGATPTDAASYATNIVWSDYRTQPTWAYIQPGGDGYAQYDSQWQYTNAVFPADVNTGVNGLASTLATVATSGQYADLLSKPTLSTVASSGAYSDLSGKPSLATVATSGAYTDLTGRPMLSVVATSGSYSDLSNKPAARSTSVASRTMNSAFQVSSTRDSLVSYTATISAAISLTTGQTGTVSLQMSPTSGGTYVEQARFTNGNTGTLTVGLSLTQTLSQPVSAYIPAGYYVKIVTSGTATISYITGQETLL